MAISANWSFSFIDDIMFWGVLGSKHPEVSFFAHLEWHMTHVVMV